MSYGTISQAKLKAQIWEEKQVAAKNPPSVGSEITIHYCSYYHASGSIVGETEKAYQVTAKNRNTGRIYTVWFPKSGLEMRAISSGDGSFIYTADTAAWFNKRISRTHELLFDALG